MKIVGVTFADPWLNEGWVEDQGFEYDVWTDDDKTLAMHYKAADSAFALAPDRITVLLDEEGDLLLGYYDGIVVGTHPHDVLSDCEVLFGD